MNKKNASPVNKTDTDDFIKYHQHMWRDIKLLERISSELDEVRSVDIMLEWYRGEGQESLSRPLQLKTLVESFEKGIMAHFNEEKGYLRELKKSGNLKSLADTFLKDHGKFTRELGSVRRQVDELLAEKPGAARNLESWQILLQNLKDLLRRIGDHAMSEEEVIFKTGHNM